MKTTVGCIRKLIKEDLFDYTGKGSEKKVGTAGGLEKIGKTASILKVTAEKLENAVRDGDEQAVHNYIQRIKQFAAAAEKALYGQN